ncbi:R3H and G-patch domain-containing protein [Schizosaccharomyces cryophilus OY26]|uniref:R3H and G-patch domain-containing protein n=1 Tax=Schizosaccharomyces cryophilus (strain OY26 / ATCC MYA-4695 / CBS 11777 / NBRC 106824 / NRRL Y48691) TaxID=653667 RepID=S9VT17_SCHCR|nr:R3H and G-patch domain-containing protein [Schizosaccharomyces cryophilus OY26]EPY49299.1 R3H and G-patch domain-containing protein [Schizosaccharomyces cryophilus OY26]
MPSYGDLEVLDQLDDADFLNSSTRIRRFKGSRKNGHNFTHSKGTRISQWPRMKFVRAVDIFNPTEEVNRMIEEEKRKRDTTSDFAGSERLNSAHQKEQPRFKQSSEIHEDIVLFKPIRNNNISGREDNIREKRESVQSQKTLHEKDAIPENREPVHMKKNIYENININEPEIVSDKNENEMLSKKSEEPPTSTTASDSRRPSKPKRLQKENMNEADTQTLKSSNRPYWREKPYIVSDSYDDLPDDESTDSDIKFNINKFANLSMLSDNDENESMEEEEVESIKAESTEDDLFYREDSDLLDNQRQHDYEYNDEELANILAETENLEDEEVNALLASVFDASDDSEIEAYLSVKDTGANDFTIYDYDSDDEPYQKAASETLSKSFQKDRKKNQKPKKMSKEERKAQRKLERQAGKSITNRLASSFDVDEDIAQELEMYSDLQEQWMKDRKKKAKKRNEREEKRAQGLLGKKSSKKLAKKAASEKNSDPDSPTLSKVDHDFIMYAYKRMQELSLSGVDEISLPACPNRLNLRSQSYGSGKKRYTVLSKTPRFNSSGLNSASLTRLLHRVQLSVGKRSEISGKPGKKPGLIVASKRTVTSATKVFEGQVVGGDAPEITRANPGRRMLERLGWFAGKGLGHPENEGSRESLRAIVKTSRSGLG